MSLKDKASITIPPGFAGKSGNLAEWNPNGVSGAQIIDLDVVRATTATRVNESGFIELVSANVPRRDFLNGGCGELLIEPQRTNLILRSEEFDNAAWLKLNSTSVANSTISPDGTANADSFVDNSTVGVHRFQQGVSVTSGDEYVITCFAKANTLNYIAILDGASNEGKYFDLVNGTVLGNLNNAPDAASITDYGNGWYRCNIMVTSPSTGTSNIQFYTSQDGSSVSYSGSGQSIFIWGAQVEAALYATSYIPTVASTVTRNQDVLSGTGLADLLGDAEGGIYVEASVFETSVDKRISISDGSSLNRALLVFSSSINLTTINGSGTQGVVNGTAISANTFYKVGFRYQLNNFVLYQDGNQQGTDLTGTTYSDGTLTNFQFADGNGISNYFYGRIRSLAIFNVAPDNSQLEAVTTP